MNRRILVRFALIAAVAALAAPTVARALQVQPGRRPHAAEMSTTGVSRPPRHPSHDPTSPTETGEERAIEREEHEESEEPADINFATFGKEKQPPYIAALINFALLMGLYYWLGKKPVAEALKARKDTVVKEIEEAQRMKREAEARAKQYQSKLAGLEDELAATRAALQESGKADQARIVKEAEEKAARMQKDTAFLLEQEVKQMRLDLQRETVDIAVAAAAELLKKRVTPADQERMAEEFLSTLNAPRAAPKATPS